MRHGVLLLKQRRVRAGTCAAALGAILLGPSARIGCIALANDPKHAGTQSEFVAASPDFAVRGVAGFIVTRQSLARASIDVLGDDGVAAVIESSSSRGWTRLSISMIDSGASLEVVTREGNDGSAVGAFFVGDELVASWSLAADGSSESSGFEQLAGMPQAGLLLAVAGEEHVQTALWPILIPLIPAMMIYCTIQCNCCENYWNNPPPGSQEPACCDACWGTLCDDIITPW